jgi:uncharacterized protein YoxC
MTGLQTLNEIVFIVTFFILAAAMVVLTVTNVLRYRTTLHSIEPLNKRMDELQAQVTVLLHSLRPPV